LTKPGPLEGIDVDDTNNSNDEGDADCIVEAVILDPARTGCSKDILSEIRKLRPKRIVYVSCNPDTQARDASILFGNEDETGESNGPSSSLPTYSLASVKPCDMFPHALHVETVAVFDRVD
jgi:23S rRNA (uracil1939-C5)-methyltransferase